MLEHYFSQNGLTACYTDTAITLFWDKPAAAGAVETYTILRNDTVADTTTKTHFTLEHLLPETEYTLFVQWRGGGIGELTVRTTPTKHWLDVAAAPYNAVGDGKTMNTAALQKAIDDCTENECVFFPAGVYLTGALRLHSNMELYLEEGAVLQGTADPEDYLPRIPSRFEGTEMECYSSLLNLGTLDHAAAHLAADADAVAEAAVAVEHPDVLGRAVDDITLRIFARFDSHRIVAGAELTGKKRAVRGGIWVPAIAVPHTIRFDGTVVGHDLVGVDHVQVPAGTVGKG